MDKDLRKLQKALDAQGFEYRATRKGHYLVKRNGKVVTTLTGTPSDHRSRKNELAELRRAGFEYGRK